MDLSVYTKEEILQPEGKEMVYVPDVIDLKPVITTDENGNEILSNAVIFDDTDRDLTEQECLLATIWQKGLDPLAMDDGSSWAQSMLGEVNPVQIMGEISNAVANTSLNATVEFSIVKDINGNELLSYKIRTEK